VGGVVHEARTVLKLEVLEVKTLTPDTGPNTFSLLHILLIIFFSSPSSEHPQQRLYQLIQSTTTSFGYQGEDFIDAFAILHESQIP